MLHLNGISKQFGAKVLFENADFHLGQRSHAALVGPNGAGKSTLIKIILGQDVPDSGSVRRASGLSIGHLAQEVPRFSNRPVLEEVMSLDGRREELLESRARVEAKLEMAGESALEEDIERLGRLIEELEHLDEYRLESRAKAILEGMGFTARDWERKLSEFSGGWLMRVALSRILLMDPDLLLLDEPTNHLDLESLLWLEGFLKSFQGALLIVSHDTEFLNRVVTEVIEIDQRKVVTYRGNLEAYAVQKQERLTLLRAQFDGQQAKIAHLEAFVKRFGAKATKASQAQSRVKQIEKLESQRVELPDDRSTVRFKFPPAPHSGKEVVTLRRAEVKYGPKTVFRDVDWVLRRGARVAIVGVNGAGKTTLLRLLSGQMQPTGGEARLGHEVKVGYYAQIQAEQLNMSKTILQELEQMAPEMPMSQVRGVAGAFLFSGESVDKKCGILSGGEKARVALAKLLLSPSNFLILDEPTNHLDVDSREILLEALEGYTGTLVIVSHDRAFMAPLVDTVLEIEPSDSGSRVVALLGSYDDYLARKIQEIAARDAKRMVQLGPQAGAKSTVGGVEEAPAGSRKGPGPSNNQKRSWERQRDQLEGEVTQLEAVIAEMNRKLADDSTYSDKAAMLQLLEERRKIESSLSEKLSQWEDVSGRLDGA